MKRSIGLFSVLVCLVVSNLAAALPHCPPHGGFQFPYNLFDSAVTGVSTLRSHSDCSSLGIVNGSRYELVAEADTFQIYREDDFFNHRPSIIRIDVPTDGDYVTTDTCNSVTISSDQIVSASLDLDISESNQGIVTIKHGAESCNLVNCPKFGVCQ